MTPAHLIALRFVTDRSIDRTTGRIQTVDLRKIGEMMRQKIIDLGMMEPPLVAVEADQVFTTAAGIAALRSREGGRG